MKKYLHFSSSITNCNNLCPSRYSTYNPDASAALDITSTTGGLLVPRMTETQRDAISSSCHWINDISNRWYSRFLLLQW